MLVFGFFLSDSYFSIGFIKILLGHPSSASFSTVLVFATGPWLFCSIWVWKSFHTIHSTYVVDGKSWATYRTEVARRSFTYKKCFSWELCPALEANSHVCKMKMPVGLRIYWDLANVYLGVSQWNLLWKNATFYTFVYFLCYFANYQVNFYTFDWYLHYFNDFLCICCRRWFSSPFSSDISNLTFYFTWTVSLQYPRNI